MLSASEAISLGVFFNKAQKQIQTAAKQPRTYRESLTNVCLEIITVIYNTCARGDNSHEGSARPDASRGEEAAYLSRHHPLPLGDQFALGTLAVLPLAVALVALQVGHQAVVTAAGAFGGPGGFVVLGWGSSGLRHLLHCWASGMLLLVLVLVLLVVLVARL